MDMSGPYEEIAFAPGDTIFREGKDAGFREGKDAGRAYFIRKGKVAILKNGNSIATMTDSMIFGETALFGGARRIVTACALEPTLCAAVSVSGLMAHIATFGPGCADGLRQMLAYIRSTLPAQQRGAQGGMDRPVDRRMRALLGGRGLKTMVGPADPFLDALVDILESYVQVRLPPVGPET